MFPFRYADQIRLGDEVLAHTNDGLAPQKVMKVSSNMMKGSQSFHFRW